ncbi:IS5 family transposase, partial [Treponema sp. J25]|uniref:IS5 family transposase n=1 Tax=Treponema sp. J25 TaxID=2094121 RepID=UPI00105156FF
MKQRGFFDEQDRLEELSRLGDPLERLNRVIDWEVFRPCLNKVFKKEAKGPGGRPPFDYVLMFKILILQRLYGISDAQAEFQIKDRLSFMRFLGLSLCDRVPDEKTIWYFRERLVQAGSIDTLFYRFTHQLEEAGLITRTGSIVDASFVDVPRQRNSREENETIKKGEVPSEWEKEEYKHKRAQKDVDARWTKKNDETHFGYKNHVKADKDSKLIVKYEVTSAEVHDSQVLGQLIEPKKDQVVYADSAYKGAEIERCLGEEIENQICEKGYRNRPLSPEQQQKNTARSRIRVR